MDRTRRIKWHRINESIRIEPGRLAGIVATTFGRDGVNDETKKAVADILMKVVDNATLEDAEQTANVLAMFKNIPTTLEEMCNGWLIAYK